jgi:hypothetical protein
MSAHPAPDDHVAVPTPSGGRREGRVVDDHLETAAGDNRRLLTVAVGGVRLVVPESDAKPR